MGSVATMTVSEARARFPELLDHVEGGEKITITRHGRPAALVVPLTRAPRRSAAAERAIDGAAALHREMEAAARIPLAERPGISDEYAEALIAEIRTGRGRR